MVNWTDTTECELEEQCEPEHHQWFLIAIANGIAYLICLICFRREDRKV